MRDGWEQRTQDNMLHYFDKPGMDVAVVGNGPISRADRVEIAEATVVIRFNDVNNYLEGEKTTLRVVRHPSWFTLKHVGAPKWHVVPTDALAPSSAALVTAVYERQHGRDNIAPDTTRLFPGCWCGDACLHNQTWAGPSTGGVALSVLQEIRNVETIDVYGMNWNGPAEMHADFANQTLIVDCCTKCVVHPTASNDYGGAFFATSIGLLTIGGIAAFFLTGGTICEVKHLLRKRTAEHDRRLLTAANDRPLLAAKHPA